MWSIENQEVLWKACENVDGFFSLFSWIFLTILSNPNRPKVSLAGLRMVSTSSCKNFRFFGHPSEKLCPVYGRFLKLCFKNDRDETNVSFSPSFSFFCFCFFLCNRRRKTRKRSLTRFVFFLFFFRNRRRKTRKRPLTRFVFSVFFWRNRRRKTRKQCWLGLWRDQTGDGGGAMVWMVEEHNATSNK